MLSIITTILAFSIQISIIVVFIVILWLLLADSDRLSRIGKRKKIKYTYIFDLDGTLIDSSIDIIGSLAKSYAQCGYVGDKSVIIPKEVIGGKIKDIIEKLTPKISQGNKARVANCFRDIYDNCGHANTTAYPGVHRFLRDNDCYCVTNKPEKPAFEIISTLDLRLIDVYAGKRGKTKAQLLGEIIKKNNLKNCVYVGDTPEDKQAACKNGCKAALVTYGYTRPENLPGCDWLIGDMRELYVRQ
jgi:phosphoglycolate phosphatase-like HAD superfamily hydrolase